MLVILFIIFLILAGVALFFLIRNFTDKLSISIGVTTAFVILALVVFQISVIPNIRLKDYSGSTADIVMVTEQGAAIRFDKTVAGEKEAIIINNEENSEIYSILSHIGSGQKVFIEYATDYFTGKTIWLDATFISQQLNSETMQQNTSSKDNVQQSAETNQENNNSSDTIPENNNPESTVTTPNENNEQVLKIDNSEAEIALTDALSQEQKEKTNNSMLYGVLTTIILLVGIFCIIAYLYIAKIATNKNKTINKKSESENSDLPRTHFLD